MATTYDEAVAALYQAPLDKFVEERKRLAAQLKVGGDKPGAARLAKLARPTVAAWAVNQLYWQARETFAELLAASERLRAGDRAAAAGRRDAMAKLRSRAVVILGDAGHATPEATLRRVSNNLSAIAAAGGFDPDPAGALTGDRETLGFDITGLVVPDATSEDGEAIGGDTSPPAGTETTPAKAEAASSRVSPDERRQRAEERQRAEQERRRQAEERARILGERRRLEAALRVAKNNVETRGRDVDELRRQLAAAERMLEETRAAVADVETQLAALEEPP